MLTSRLKEARLRAGLSQERLGTLAGLDEMSASSRMNQYERGKHTPGFFLMERLAQALGLPTPWFYTRDDDTADLLFLYHNLSPTQREQALAFIRQLVQRPADGQEQPAPRYEGKTLPVDGLHYPLHDPHGGITPGADGVDAHASHADGQHAMPVPDAPPDATTYSRSSPGRSPNTTPARRPSASGRNRK